MGKKGGKNILVLRLLKGGRRESVIKSYDLCGFCAAISTVINILYADLVKLFNCNLQQLFIYGFSYCRSHSIYTKLSGINEVHSNAFNTNLPLVMNVTCSKPCRTLCICIQKSYCSICYEVVNIYKMRLLHYGKGKGKAILLQALTGPEGSTRLSLPGFKTIRT
jgi:hypothetical protein